MGHEVRTAHDGPAALEAAEAFRPEVVLLDIGLPGMDGYEVARRLRERPARKRRLLVALTGWGQEEDRRRTGRRASTPISSSPPTPTNCRVCSPAAARRGTVSRAAERMADEEASWNCHAGSARRSPCR